MATTPGSRRFLAAILAATFAAAVPAKGNDWMPLLPDQDFYDFQLFAPPDLNSYSMYKEASEGLFFNYDRLYLGITVPNVVPVGNTDFFPVEPLNPNVAQQLNSANGGFAGIVIYGTDQFNLSLDTSWIRTKMSWGNRYEGGWIYEDRGMLFSYWDSGPQGQEFTTVNEYALNTPEQTFTQDSATSAATVGGVAVPIITTTITSTSPPPDHAIAQEFRQSNETRIQSAGAAWLIRRELGRRGSGSTVRFGLGPRFLQLADRYSMTYQSYQYGFDSVAGGDVVDTVNPTSGGDVQTISGNSSLTGLSGGSQLQQGDWETYASNNIAGPEFSLHFESTKGRWTVLSDFKFTSGFNFQNMIYRGSNFPASLSADFIRSTFTTATTFSAATTTTAPVVVSGQPLYVQVFGLGQKNATNIAEHQFTFTPIGEWRLGTEFRVSQAIMLRAGYTGMWMGQIARASANTAYVTQTDIVQQSVANPAFDPSLPVGPTNTQTIVADVPVDYTRIAPPAAAIQDYVLTNGIDFGVEIKY